MIELRKNWNAVGPFLLRSSIVGAVLGWWIAACPGFLAAQEAITYDPKNKRDPFVPCTRDGKFLGCGVDAPGAQRPWMANQDLHLAAIVWDPSGKSLAIINEAVVGVGEMVNGFRVSEIRNDAVTLTRGPESLTLRITFDRTEPPKETHDGTPKNKHPSRGGGRP